MTWRRRSEDDEIADEIRQHLDEAAEEMMARGMTPDQARAAARRQFGNVTLLEERSRDVRRWRFAQDFLGDARYALRQIRRAPAFAATAVVTLAVGIGATTAIFSAANAALLHPLPYPQPDRLVSLNEIVPIIANVPIRLPAPDLVDYTEQSRSFDAVGGWTPRTYELSGNRESERIQGARATAGLFDVLRIAPALGRTFTAQEDRDGVPVCVISDGLWQRWFGRDPGVLGRTVHLDRMPYRVIGVMPRTFDFRLRPGNVAPTDVWVPMAFTAEERAARSDSWDYNGIARMKAGVTAAQASADVNAIAQRIVQNTAHAAAGDGGSTLQFTAMALPLAPQLSAAVRPVVLALGGAVAFLLLIACVNVANLLLARGAHRQREMAVRAALGAGRGRLLRQLVAETLVLSIIAAGIGTALAFWLTSLAASRVPARFAVLGLVRPDWTALVFSAAVAIVVAVLAGVMPGLAASGIAAGAALNVRSETGGIGLRRVRSVLVAAEIALALVLLVGAGLLARTFQDLLRADAGFRPEQAVGAYISLPASTYAGRPQEREFYRSLLDRLRMPGVDAAGLGTQLPLTGHRSQRVFWPDGYHASAGNGLNIADMCVATPQYVEAIGATIERGRSFTRQDDANGQPVAIVSASLARRYWGTVDPIGKRLKWGMQDSPSPWLTVVGVVNDIKQESLDAPASDEIIVPADQVEHSIVASMRAEFATAQLRSMYVVVRGAGGETALASRLRDTVRTLDPRLPLTRLGPLSDAVSTSAAPQRFNLALMGGFAGIALLLAIVGLYGLVSYSVAQRAREIGIRMAMGADASAVVRMIVRDGLVLACAGTIAGAIGAAALTPTLRSLLYGVQPFDLPTFASVAALLIAIAMLATYVPARRATSISPTEALRGD